MQKKIGEKANCNQRAMRIKEFVSKNICPGEVPRNIIVIQADCSEASNILFLRRHKIQHPDRTDAATISLTHGPSRSH